MGDGSVAADGDAARGVDKTEDTVDGGVERLDAAAEIVDAGAAGADEAPRGDAAKDGTVARGAVSDANSRRGGLKAGVGRGVEDSGSTNGGVSAEACATASSPSSDTSGSWMWPFELLA